MVEINLTKGLVATIDESDFQYVNQFKWSALKGTNTYYAVRRVRKGKLELCIYLHRDLMNPEKGVLVDHVDRNGLNCQRSNMRLCNKSQNGFNRTANGEIKYVGVSKHMSGKRLKYRVQIFHEGKRVPVRLFDTPEEAAKEYDLLAAKLRGEFATQNVKNA